MKNYILKATKVLLPTVISLFFFASMASAHVTVVPKTSTTGAWETYTMKVPVEKAVPTTKVTVKAPAGVEIMSYQPVPGWNYTAEKDADGKVKSFTFEAIGDGILPGQFQSFTFVAKNPENATKAAWDAYQYYRDGSIVEWTGDEGAEAPHAITDIVKSTATDHDHHQSQQTEQKETNTAKNTIATTDSTSSWPLILSIAALLLALVSLGMSMRKK